MLAVTKTVKASNQFESTFCQSNCPVGNPICQAAHRKGCHGLPKYCKPTPATNRKRLLGFACSLSKTVSTTPNNCPEGNVWIQGKMCIYIYIYALLQTRHSMARCIYIYIDGVFSRRSVIRGYRMSKIQAC